MKVLPICCCFFVVGMPILSAAQSVVGGRVINSKVEPLIQTNVLLLNASDSSLVKGVAASKEGQFSFEHVKPGRYLVMASCRGYSTRYSGRLELKDDQPALQMQDLVLEEEVIELDKVQVQSRRPLLEQKIDRLVVNVRNSITSAGSTALEILERSPGIIVNRQANTISMSGKDGVTVMINGKISYMPVTALVQMLEGMNAGSIERIELITTPPAHLDAQGNAGYINIILLNNPDFGWNGSLSTSVGYGDGLTTNHSISFNYRKNKLNFFGDYAIGINKRQPYFHNYRRVIDQGNSRESFTTTDRYPTRLSQNARLGLDLQISKKTMIGLLASAYMNRYSMHETITNANYLNQQKDTQLVSNNNEVNNWRNADFNINVQHNIKAGETISVDLNHLLFRNRQPFTYHNVYSNGTGQSLLIEDVRTNKRTPIQFWVAKLDYSKTLNSTTAIEAGLKFTTSRFDNDVSVERSQNNGWKIDSQYTSFATLKENISAAYLSFNINPTEKTNLKLGLRYEYTNSNLGTPTMKDLVDRHYGRLFPTFFISRKIADDQSINFSYSRRINRPPFTDLAPFIFFFDPNTFFSGNPALQPSINDQFGFGYTLRRYLITANYSYENDFIAVFQSRIDPKTNKQLIFAENLRAVQTLSLQFSAPVNITKWWTLQSNISGTWQQADLGNENKGLKVKQVNLNLRVIQTFTLPKDISMELGGFYQSASIFGRYRVNGYGQLDFGFQKKFKTHNQKIRLAYTDIFSTSKWIWRTNISDDNFARTTLQFTKATIQLTYSRSFGRNSVKAARQRMTGAAEEKDRIR
jgi:outer membrane receptor protein involved in Fe transport